MVSAEKKTVVITGATGQLGFHCRARLQFHHGFEIIPCDRATLSDDDKFEAAVSRADAIVHLAGVNRASDEEIISGNLELAKRVVSVCDRVGANPQIVYASTIQVARDNAYGKSKKQAGELIAEFCARTKAPYVELVLPNLFGEFSRPNYNNFTGTFAHQIASGVAPSVRDDSPVSLLHYRDAADRIAQLIMSSSSGEVVLDGHPTSVGEIANLLSVQYEDYAHGVIPDVRDSFSLDMFNLLRNVMFTDQFPAMLTRHADPRGSFFECIRARNSGQTSFSTTVPGVTRGDHFHFKKVERFIVLSGHARISLRRVFDDQRIEFDVSGDKPCYVDMPSYYTHNIQNTGSSELTTLFWTHDFFDPNNHDTYPETV